MKHREITDRVICCFYNVYTALGYGFLEKVYENALLIELERCNIPVVSQSAINVVYRDQIVGQYYADLVVGNNISMEIFSPLYGNSRICRSSKLA